MNILLYYQNHYHTVFLESLCQGFVKRGHKVHLLTTCERGKLHEEMEKLGVFVHTHVSQSGKLTQYFKQFFYLIRFCKTNKIDVVYSHLQFANLIAVMARYFISAKVFPCRHHSTDVVVSGNRNAIKMDRLVNRFCKQIIVVSSAVKAQMVDHEGVSPHKIMVINLGYNFELYHKPDPAKVKEIRTAMNCEMLLIVISRMNPPKQHIVAAEVLNELIQKKLNVKMIMMDDGTEKEKVVAFLKSKGIEDKVLFTGFVNNTMDHLSASDLLLHPSITEASNQVVKEAAWLYKPSIVCKGVGDFDEYIVHEVNGFSVNKNNVVNEMTELIERYYRRKEELKIIGERIHSEVLNRFAIDRVCEQYIKLASHK
jgi:glycosyltransferase involved in cell wall biosynthesis